MVYFSFNLAKNGPICEKTYPQKRVTKIRQNSQPCGESLPSSMIVTNLKQDIDILNEKNKKAVIYKLTVLLKLI